MKKLLKIMLWSAKKEHVDKLAKQVGSSVRDYISERFQLAESEHSLWMRKELIPNLHKNTRQNGDVHVRKLSTHQPCYGPSNHKSGGIVWGSS